MMKPSLILILIVLVADAGGPLAAQRALPFSKEPPVWSDFDMEAIPEPEEVETGYFYDFADGTFFQQVKQVFDVPRHLRKVTGKPKEAYNVNVLDEVPDSSWFTNRNGRRRLTLDEIKRGPDEDAGPADGPLTVVSGKSAGITPGFRVRDQRGGTYLIKFDPPDYPELATAAEVITTKLFHAIGYNVPQNTIFRFHPEQLRLDPKAPFTDSLGRKRTMTEADLEEILKRAARQSDGRYRAVASKLLKGRPKGGFSFAGVRRDDPNDIIPHEHRRDLRALRVFCAWLEHNDIRVGNTLDLYVTEAGRSFLRHYLIDFGSTLGSDTSFPNVAIVGHEYQLDGAEMLKVALSLGLYQQPWHRHRRQVRYPGVGLYSAADFAPARWKQNFPLVAFENMTDRDGYWAAKIVGSFTDEQIRAAVETGELSDPEAAQYLTEQIIRRRDKIVRYYTSRRAALDRFRVETMGDGFVVRFDDARIESNGRRHKNGNEAVYEYEIRPWAAPKKPLARGRVSTRAVGLSLSLLGQVSALGRTEPDQGVAELIVRRLGEEQAAQVYVYYEKNRARLDIIGVQH